MSGRARQLVLWAAGVAAGLAVALSISGRERVLALFAFLLLLGAAATGVLVRRAAREPRAADLPRRPPEPPSRRLPQLDDIARELERALELRADADGALRARFRVVAAARLADRRGIDLDRQPERARAALGDDLTWELVRARDRYEPVSLPPLRAAELRRVLECLERL